MFCPNCRLEKTEDDFYHYQSGKMQGQRHAYCKSCHQDYQHMRRQTLEGRFSELKKDAKKRGIEWLLTKEDVREMWQKNCTYCGNEVELISLDRRENKEPYVAGNVSTCCRWCNYTKGQSSLAFFYAQCKKVVENMPEHLRIHGSVDDAGARYENQMKSFNRAKKGTRNIKKHIV